MRAAAYVTALCFSLYTLPAEAQTCPEVERKLLTYVLKVENLEGTVALMESQKQLFLDNEVLFRTSNKLTENMLVKSQRQTDDAERRAIRQWWEQPAFLIGVGVAGTLAVGTVAVVVLNRISPR